VVARATNTLGQTGVVVGVRQTLQLEQEAAGAPGVPAPRGRARRAAPPPRTLSAVSGAAARQVRGLHAGDFVTCGRWLGQVEEVCDSLLLRQEGGGLARVPDATPESVQPRRLATLMGDPEDCPYYPGQPVTASQPAVLRTARWLAGGWRGRLDAVVEAVEAGEARVRWIAALGREGAGEAAPPPPPPELQPVAGLTRLQAFDDITWQIGDRALIRREVAAAIAAAEEARLQEESGRAAQPPPPAAAAAAAAEEAAEEEEEPEGWHTVGKRKSRRKAGARGGGAAARADARAPPAPPPPPPPPPPRAEPRAMPLPGGPPLVARVTATHTFVTVQWQDGSLSAEEAATSFVPVTHLVEGDFWAEEFVTERAEDGAQGDRVGLIRAVDAARRTAQVAWLQRDARSGRLALPREAAGLPAAQVVSVYDLDPAAELNFRIGDAVMLLDSEAGSPPLPPAAASWVGQVVALAAGWLTVQWADGRRTRAQPDEVYPIHGEDEEEEEEEEEESEGDVWEQLPASAGAVPHNGLGHAQPQHWSLPSFGGWIAAAAQRGLGLGGAAGEAAGGGGDGDGSDDGSGSGGWETDEGSAEGAGEGEEAEEAEEEDEAAEEERRMAAMLASLPSPPPPPPAPPPPHPQPQPPPPPAAAFALFDTVSGGAEDHLYGGEAAAGGDGFAARQWAKALRREWALLRGGLPADGSLTVRAWEARTDCLRACVAGAESTPYHRHLFFFDLHFGANYPAEAPAVSYHAHGLRCNPNLYANGKVCLSLLGTWAGRGGEFGETWRPGESSALQVLLSIQALVLNEKPYFNEAGWSGQAGSEEGERNSRQYNEQVRLICLRSSLALLRAPPAHFAELVAAHYRRHAAALLAEAAAELGLEEGAAGAPSEGYRASLARLMPRLQEVLGPLADAGAPR